MTARDKDGETPLHWAASGGSPAVVDLLIARGADMKAEDDEGKTPIDNARENEALKGSDAHWRLNEELYE